MNNMNGRRMALLFFALFLGSVTAFGQASGERLSIFLDCQMRCDFTYIKEQIQFVNYMQDRQEADVYILATRQRTGSGGNEIRLEFLANGDYEKLSDTLTYFVDPDATDAIFRDELVNNLKKGLLPYLAISPLADQISYSIEVSEDIVEEEIDDPWNYWVFNVGGNMWVNGEDQFSSIDLSTRFNASRVTDKMKFRLNLYYGYDRSTFTLTDGEEFINIQKTYNYNVQYVKSVSERFSVGFRANGGSSTFGNTDLATRIKPALEYNVFPYSESSTRRFTFFYSIGPEIYNYSDTTVYDKLKETVVRHGLDIEYEQTRQWGEVSMEVGVNQYLHDLSLYSFYINPELSWNIFKGFSINLGGYFSLVGDRINIAKSDITDEDILLQIKQLDTDFSYFSYMGINYRFGSKYNNYVNTRF